MHPQRYFTEANFPEYNPLHSMFDKHTKKVTDTQRRLKHLFHLVPTCSALH